MQKNKILISIYASSKMKISQYLHFSNIYKRNMCSSIFVNFGYFVNLIFFFGTIGLDHIIFEKRPSQ